MGKEDSMGFRLCNWFQAFSDILQSGGKSIPINYVPKSLRVINRPDPSGPKNPTNLAPAPLKGQNAGLQKYNSGHFFGVI
jgi:hypothetical protein